MTEHWYDEKHWHQHPRSTPPHDGPASPRPWRKNPGWAAAQNSMLLMPSPFLDANDRAVLATSEWLTISEANIDLILRAVNALPAGDAPESLESS